MRKRIALAIVAALGLSACGGGGGGSYTDGEYTGTAPGYNGDLQVMVTITDGKIASVELGEHQETPGMFEAAAEEVPQRIVEEQKTNVEATSGATMTSNGIMGAAEDALQQAN